MNIMKTWLSGSNDGGDREQELLLESAVVQAEVVHELPLACAQLAGDCAPVFMQVRVDRLEVALHRNEHVLLAPSLLHFE